MGKPLMPSKFVNFSLSGARHTDFSIIMRVVDFSFFFHIILFWAFGFIDVLQIWRRGSNGEVIAIKKPEEHSAIAY